MIFTTENMPNYLKFNQIKHFLILDDAAYSGTHMRRELSGGMKNIPDSACIYIGIPFQTHQALHETKVQDALREGLYDRRQFLFMKPEKSIERTEKFRDRLTIKNLPHKTIPVISDFLPKKEKREAELEMQEKFRLLTRRQSLTTFDHKKPDGFSLLDAVRNGIPLFCPSFYRKMHGVQESDPIEKRNQMNQAFLKERYTLIPDFISPYKLHTQYEQDKLEALLKTYPDLEPCCELPERFEKAREIIAKSSQNIESQNNFTF